MMATLGVPSLRAFWCTRDGGNAGGAGGQLALLPEREVSSQPLSLPRRRRRQNREYGYPKKPWRVNYPTDAPGPEVLKAVFGPTAAHHLNPIACSGIWTGTGYDERLVVFTTHVT